jgi:hypothetical protein
MFHTTAPKARMNRNPFDPERGFRLIVNTGVVVAIGAGGRSGSMPLTVFNQG